MGENAGRVRVAVRVRPLLSFEKTERLGECLSCVPQSKQLCVGDGGDNGRNTFTFDFTFPKACEQRALYDDCVASLLEGRLGHTESAQLIIGAGAIGHHPICWLCAASCTNSWSTRDTPHIGHMISNYIIST